MSRLVELTRGRYAHASGALWLPELRTVLIADTHLGYAWAQRRRGELGPVVEGSVGRKLEALVDELEPAELVVIGDLVHAPRPHDDERMQIERIVRRLAARTLVMLVPGNHDRGFVRDFPGLPLEIIDCWCGAGLMAVHGHLKTAPESHLVIGHIHPAICIRDDAGASQKIPVFLAGPGATVLPAFSPFAAGASLGQALTKDLRKLLGEPLRILAASGTRVVALASAY